MAIYDPYSPQVIGPQWTPVRQESYPIDLPTEIGYTFTVTGSSGSVNEIRFADWICSHIPTTLVQGQVPFVSIYRHGEEVDVGRAYRLIIPLDSDVGVASVAVTGASSNSGSPAQAVTNQFDDNFITLGTGNSTILAFFGTDQFQSELQGKRILKVNLLYTASGAFNELDNVSNGVFASLESLTTVWSMGLGSIIGPLSQRDTARLGRVNFGDINPFWSGGANPFSASEKYPWRWEELNRMRKLQATATRFGVGIHGQNLPILTQPIRIHYMALEILYCEENRLWYGGNAQGGSVINPNAFDAYARSANRITLRTTSFQATGGLDPGDYAVTITLADAGDSYNRGDKPHISSIRQIEPLLAPGSQGILITKWQEPGDLIGEPFRPTHTQYDFVGNPPTIQSSNILPGIGLQNSIASPLNATAPHVYHRQVQAHIEDGTFARQRIINTANSSLIFYPWVRFYARHFGDTSRTLRLRQIGGGIPSIVTITQAELDALPEIIDGWREVTLRFTSNTPSFNDLGTISTWEWDTINGSVTPEHHWEIMGAGSELLGSTANYGGTTLGFASFNDHTIPSTTVLSFADTDLMLMFSQDPPAVTGFGVSLITQPITGIGSECFIEPECVPTDIVFNQVTWTAATGNVICDTYSRSVSGSWGQADTDQDYTEIGGSSSDFIVTGGVGQHIFAAGTGSRISQLDSMFVQNPDMHSTFSINQIPVGDELVADFVARSIDINNQYVIAARIEQDMTVTALIQRIQGGVLTTLATATVPNLTFVIDQAYNIRGQINGSTLRCRIWEEGRDQPNVWHAIATDSSVITGGVVGIRSSVESGYTGNYPVIFSVDNFTVNEITETGHTFELQRQDDVDPTWFTIMITEDLCPTTFNDYEARVGVESRYRIRRVNAMRFPGPWSSEVASTIPAPGISGAEDGNSVLIFTTNEDQSGLSNLAHVMVWDRNVDEEFNFPEVGSVQLQTMYRRDFVTAFRPEERGGERFSRLLLVHNTLVPTRRIRDGFTALRDLAWNDVSYVCVRNELGDRWLATVLVSEGSVSRNRRQYLARVEVIEVTSTPSEVMIAGISDES